MTNNLPMAKLAHVVRDLTTERLLQVETDDDIVDPTITSRTHTISVASIQKGGSVKIKKRVQIAPGDLVFSRLHTQNGAFAFADRRYFATTSFIPLAVDENLIDRRFLFWALHARVPSLSASDTVGRETYKPQEILNLEIPLPPLPEQKRIVATIEHFTTKTDEVLTLRNRAKTEAEVVLSSAFSQAYDEATKLAGGVVRLADLCHQITDGTHQTPTYVTDGVPFLSVKDITSGEIRFDQAKLIMPEEHARLIKRCRPERGDVLLTKVGTTGFAKVIDVDREFSIFVSLALLKLDKSRLDPKFTECMLNSSRLREYSRIGTRGVGNQNLVLKFIREFPTPAPPLKDQRKILAYLEDLEAKVDILKQLQAETATELTTMLSSILSKVLKGELITADA